eukprot:1032395-Ditylum_brightwellii.AAC.1
MDSSTDEAVMEEIHKVLLDLIDLHITMLIKIGVHGAVNTDEPGADGFYIVQFIGCPHTLQADVVVNDEVIAVGS